MKKRDDIYIAQIQERLRMIDSHLKNVSRSKFLKSELHKAAIVRELEVIGEAARLVSDETKRRFTKVPWAQMMGMRNRLIHEYFNVDYSIVWEVASVQLPELKNEFEAVFLSTAPPAHRWRKCPSGFYHVKEHRRRLRERQAETTVHAHCRRNPSGKDQLYLHEIELIGHSVKPDAEYAIGSLSEPQTANSFDTQILVWTQYWNEVFNPKERLSPNTVKALMYSESSFNINVPNTRISKNNLARGLMQITDATRRILADENGELSDYFLTLSDKDIKSSNGAIAASVRWLFHKKDLASKYLGREATWIEAIANYKGYLRLNTDPQKHRGMRTFINCLSSLEKKD